MNHSDSINHLPSFVEKMEKEGLHPVVIDTFKFYYNKVVTKETGLISGREIRPVSAEDVKDASQIEKYADSGRSVLKNAIMIKLNGGLGTSMGLAKAKSLLAVKEGKSFLEIILGQAATSKVKLAFMNSFSTHEDTLDALSRIRPKELPILFLQNKFPKILQESLEPAVWPKNPDLEWNPPGHGDIYSAIYASGMLTSLLEKGIRYAFISNSDNLGATIDEALLGYFSEHRFPLMMEVAPRTPADIKGGHIARHVDGHLILRESAQCPENELQAFQNIKLYGFFNTNNIWINLGRLEELIKAHGTVNLPMIRNPKTLDPRDETSPWVYQIETAMGAAISLFKGATVIKVPPYRFFPVKKCNDLLLIRSDRFIYKKNRFMLNPDVRSGDITIDLDPKYFGKIDFFNERFAQGVPSLLNCQSLSVVGDVCFENNVTVKGRVVIENKRKSQAILKKGTVIDRDLIFS